MLLAIINKNKVYIIKHIPFVVPFVDVLVVFQENKYKFVAMLRRHLRRRMQHQWFVLCNFDFKTFAYPML